MRLWLAAILACVPAAPLAAAAGDAPRTAATQAATTRPDAGLPDASPVLIAILAVGFWVLVVWCVRRIARPAKLRLADAPPRANSLNPIHVLAVVTLWLAAGAGAKELLGLWYAEDDLRLTLLSGVSGQVAMVAGGLLVAHFAFRRGLRRGAGLSLRRWLSDLLRSVVACLAFLPVGFGLLLLTELLVPPERMPVHVVLEAVRDLGGGWSVFGGAMAIVLAPLGEELLFRGILQTMLRRYLGRPWAAIALTGVFFALVHAPYWHTMPVLFLLAAVLGYNYERTGRLTVPILIHALFNAVNVANTVWWSK